MLHNPESENLSSAAHNDAVVVVPVTSGGYCWRTQHDAWPTLGTRSWDTDAVRMPSGGAVQMSSQSLPRHRTAAVIAGAGALLVIGMAGALIAGSGPTAPSQAAPVVASPATEPAPDVEAEPDTGEGASSPSFPTNTNGQTYGSAAEAGSDDAMPDLVAVQMPDGSVGYIYSEELIRLEGGHVSSPEEALEWNETVKNIPTETNDAGVTYIPITAYESDGVTEIGTWEGLSGG